MLRVVVQESQALQKNFDNVNTAYNINWNVLRHLSLFSCYNYVENTWQVQTL